jgi:catechol-2,3-dioxygenase
MDAQLAVISLWAEDVFKTARFYHDVIGLQHAKQHGHNPHFDLDGAYLVILKGRPQPAANPTPARFPILAFSVSNLADAVARLATHEVEMPWGIEEDAGSRWVMFHDPAGNLIELVEFMSGASPRTAD